MDCVGVETKFVEMRRRNGERRGEQRQEENLSSARRELGMSERNPVQRTPVFPPTDLDFRFVMPGRRRQQSNL